MSVDPPRHGEGDRPAQPDGGGAVASKHDPGRRPSTTPLHGAVPLPASGEDQDHLESARKLFAGPVDFLLSAPALEFLPEPIAPEIAFAGRSNVGKSSLLNALTGRNALARTSNTPGRTQELNFFDVGGSEGGGVGGGRVPVLRLVDMPGYGFAKAPPELVRRWRYLINDFLRGRQALKRALVLIDARHGIKDVDRDIMTMLDRAAVGYRLVLTKADKIKPTELSVVAEATVAEARKRPAAYPDILATSSETGLGIPELRAAVLEAIG